MRHQGLSEPASFVGFYEDLRRLTLSEAGQSLLRSIAVATARSWDCLRREHCGRAVSSYSAIDDSSRTLNIPDSIQIQKH
jgi:hypothetical protein